MSKRIYTSYYAIAKKLPADHPQVSISRSCPRWWKPPDGVRLHEPRLAPSAELLSHSKSLPAGDESWKHMYREEMLRQDLQAIYDALPDGCVLLCWEKDSNECHRSLALELLEARCGATGCELAV